MILHRPVACPTVCHFLPGSLVYRENDIGSVRARSKDGDPRQSLLLRLCPVIRVPSKLLKSLVSLCSIASSRINFPMGRRPTEEELNDPDFRALLAALKKVSKPVGHLRAKPPEPSPTRTPANPRIVSATDLEQ